MYSNTFFLSSYRNNRSAVAKQLAESNNNSLSRETGPPGEEHARAVILSHTHKHTPARTPVDYRHMLKQIRAPQVLHSAVPVERLAHVLSTD